MTVSVSPIGKESCAMDSKQNKYLKMDEDCPQKELRPSEFGKNICNAFKAFFSQFFLFVNLAWKNVSERLMIHILSLVSFIFTTMVCCVFMSWIDSFPFILVNFAEKITGSTDMNIQNANQAYFNNDRFLTLTSVDPMLTSSSPRSNLFASIDLDHVFYFSTYHLTSYGDVLFIDPDKESARGIGVNLGAYLKNDNDVIVSQNEAHRMTLKVGDSMLMTFDPLTLKFHFSASGIPSQSVESVARVSHILPSENGELNTLSNYVMSLKTADSFLDKGLLGNPGATRDKYLGYSNTSKTWLMNFPPKDRHSILKQSKTSGMIHDYISFYSKIINRLGFGELRVRARIPTILAEFSELKSLLTVTTVLFILITYFETFFLNYSVMMGNIDMKRQEIGIQRMIGFTQYNCLTYILVNSLMISIPGWIIGVITGFIVEYVASILLLKKLNFMIPPVLTPISIFYSLAVVLSISIFACIFPFRRILSTSLSTALFSAHSGSDETKAVSDHQATFIFRWNLLLLGAFFLITSVFTILYLKNSFAIGDMEGISLLMTVSFVSMLGGFVLLCMTTHGIYQILSAYLLFFWEKRSVLTLVVQNLLARQERNKVFIFCFSLGIGLVIITSSIGETQLNTVSMASQVEMGSDLRIYNRLTYDEMLVVDEFVHSYGPENGITRSGWSSDEYILAHERGVSVSDISKGSSHNATFHGLSPFFFSTVFQDSYRIKKIQRMETKSVMSHMYNRDGLDSSILSYKLYKKLTTSKDSKDIVFNNPNPKFFPFRDTLKSIMGVSYSLPIFTRSNIIFTPMDAFLHESSSGVSIENLIFTNYLIKTSKPQVCSESLKAFFLKKTSKPCYISLFVEQSKEFEDLIAAFGFLSGVQIFLIYLLMYAFLASNMTMNILFQSREIGILRSIGMKWFPIFRMFAWEAFVLLFVGCLMGLIVGYCISMLFIYQFEVISSTYLVIPFNWGRILLMILLSVVVGFLSTLTPLLFLYRKSVSGLLSLQY